jgi:hypothetical protein
VDWPFENYIHNMVTLDSGIVLDFPPTWDQFTEGSRCVFHSPLSEEVIVSAQSIRGEVAAGERASWLARMVEAGLEAARRGVASPQFRLLKPLTEDSEACGLRCWTVMAETTARDAFYGQAVLCHQQGTLFVTYESPYLNGAEQVFRKLLKNIHES